VIPAVYVARQNVQQFYVKVNYERCEFRNSVLL